MNAKLLKQISDNLTPLDTEELYCNMLDDCYGETNIAGMNYQTSRILKEVDPTAFRCGEANYIDSLSLVEIQGDYYEQDAVEQERDALISDLESAIEAVEEDLASEEECEELHNEEILNLKLRIVELECELEEVKNYCF